MARVFRGKIAIPGDQMEAYLETSGPFENEKAPMRTQLEQYAGDFARALAQQYAPKTVRKHTAIIALHDATAIVSEDHQHEEYAERDGRDHKEIQGNKVTRVVL